MKFVEEDSLICFNICSLCLKQDKEMISFREQLYFQSRPMNI